MQSKHILGKKIKLYCTLSISFLSCRLGWLVRHLIPLQVAKNS